ncbi:hypothetical protein ACFOWE_32520 [Planomonospora corallina]|uniref:Uncharacterized protein n=1 Tax=Planomonospora corallina TaxID=1806052 RepID=A0ABV8IFL4_9ACTN
MIIGLAFVGFLAFVVINLVVGIAAVSTESAAGIGTGAVFLALIAFGGGIWLTRRPEPWAKGLGIGLMAGWALVSIVSAGFCTGLNPQMYQ